MSWAGRGMTNVLVEGGGRVLGSFLDAGQVDAVEVFIAPSLEGGDHAQTAARGRGLNFMREAARLRGVNVAQVGGDIHVSADGYPKPGALGRN